MHYILNADNYISAISFGCDIECADGYCQEYTGSVPPGYTSLDAWYVAEGEKLYRWKIVNGQLTLDVDAVAPKDCTIFDLVYPVGAIYMSTVEVSPAALFGGTWEQIVGKFLLAAGDDYAAGSTGGEAEHALTVDEMPSHDHYGMRRAESTDDYVKAGDRAWGITAGNNTSAGMGYPTSSAGGGQPHNNMPPYLAVYMWKRTA